MFEGVSTEVDIGSTFVASGVNAGLLALALDFRSRFCPLRKVFLAVGDVADSVSNLKLVDPFPYTGLTFEVLSDSFGFFDGEGPGGSSVGTTCCVYVIGDEGRRVSDMVLVPMVLGA